MPVAELASHKEALYASLGSVSDTDVRLITLHPGQFQDAIRCELRVAPASDEYEALSYTWGLKPSKIAEAAADADEWEDVDDAAEQLAELTTDEARIEVNGHQVEVMPNLHQALQHLRSADAPRTLWVDFLCINQQDVADRNAQVARMDRIYRSAARVVVWLGAESGDSSLAVGELLGLAANVHLSLLYPGSEDETRARIRPVVNLLSRAYFLRTWVVQEVALSREVEVRLGARSVPWDFFLRAGRAYRDHLQCCAAVMSPYNDRGQADDFLELRNGLANVFALDREALRGLDLHTALRLYHSRAAADPRDKVFGLLGLLEPSRRLVAADYARSAPEVYEDVALRIIEKSGDLCVLTDIDEYAGEVDAASWAPDWTTGAALGLELYEHFRTAGSLAADARKCSPHTLKLSGLIFDNVTSVVGDDEPAQGELLTAFRRLQAWEDLAAHEVDGPSPYAAGEARKEAFWQTVMMGMSADRERRLRPRDDAGGWQVWRQWLEKYANALDQRAFREAGSRVASIRGHNAMLARYPETRWFFTTEDGYLGLGPVEMEEGDVVCVLYGGKMPFVLRAVDESCDVCDNEQLCYQLVGFAYVHGIMDGETVRGLEADEQEATSFCLR